MNIVNYLTQKPVVVNINRHEDKITQSKQEYKKDILDIFSEKVVNKNDINDMVKVPRTIFKGYLCFTAGTVINAISGKFNKSTVVGEALSIAGSLLTIFGTYNFVKPFLIRDEQELTKTDK